MGRRKKNNNKNKGHKKPNPDIKSYPKVADAANNLPDTSNKESKDVPENILDSEQNVKVEYQNENVVEYLSANEHDHQQASGGGRRSLKDRFEDQHRDVSPEGSVTSSLERELVAELENVIGQDEEVQLPAESFVPKLDLNFLNESESDSATGTLVVQTLNGTLNSTNDTGKSVKQQHGNPDEVNESVDGLTYANIKNQNSAAQADDIESGIGTVVYSSNTDEAIEEDNEIICPSVDIRESLESRLENYEGGSDFDINRPESRMMFYDRNLPDSTQVSIQDIPSISLNSDDNLSQEYNNDHQINRSSDSNSTLSRGSPFPGMGTENITVSAYVSEPNLATFLRREKSPSIVDDTSEDVIIHSGSSTPRSFADMGQNAVSLEMIPTKEGGVRIEERPPGRCEYRDDVVVKEYDLDSSLDPLPLSVKFSNQGTSLFDEMKASEENLHKEHEANGDPQEHNNLTVNGHDNKSNTPRTQRDEDKVSEIGSALESARTGISKASSIKEDDNLSNSESVTDYGPSPSEGSKSFSDQDSIIERMPPHMQSAPALLEAQKLEENYREFMSSSDFSQENAEHDDTVENIAVENKASSNPSVIEQLSQVEYKICYDMGEEQAEHPGLVYLSAMDNIVNDDLNAGFILESSMDNITESSHNVEIMHDAEEIAQDREHVSMVLSHLNQEIERLRDENKSLYGEMTMYRNSSKQYKGKNESMDGYIKKLRSHVKSLEIQMADINSQRQNIKNSFTMTEQVLLLNTSTQVHPVTYDSHMQTEILTCNKGSQVEDFIGECKVLSIDCATSTDELQNIGSISSSSSSLSRPTGSVSPIKVQIEMEDDQRKKPANKASDMLDKLIRQMSSIAGNETENSEISRSDVDESEWLNEMETPEKWRRLVTTPLRHQNVVLQLQASLASAADQFDNVKATNKTKENDLIRNAEELEMKLKDTFTDLEKVREESESWQMKYEGDHTEIKVLRDKLSIMEKDLLLAQMDKERLEQEFSKVKSKSSDVKDSIGESSADKDVKENIQEKVLLLEEDKKKLQEELASVRESQSTEVDQITDLETALKNSEEQREELENELKFIREEYHTLQRTVQSMEKSLYLNTEDITDTKKLSLVAEARIAELKKHVFDSKSTTVKKRAKSTESLVSNHSSATSIHDDIIQQSELVLDVLRKSGDLKDEEDKQEEQLVDWEQVKNSIENQLNGVDNNKEDNKPRVESEEQTEVQNQPANNTSAIADPTIKEHLSELASAISNDFGVKVNITVDGNSAEVGKSSSPGTLDLDIKETQIMELDRLNRDYEQMRKKRLEMLMKTYRGGDELEKSWSKNPKSAWNEPPMRNNDSLFAKSLDSHEWNRQSDTFDGKRHPVTSLRSRPQERNSVLRQSQEELNNLLSDSSGKVPRVCVTKTGKSHNMMTASTSDSPTPYSYRLKREIYPHKKGYMPADKFYESAQQQEDEYYGNTDVSRRQDYGYRENVNAGNYRDSYYDDRYYQNYPEDRRSSYGEYSDTGSSFYGNDPYSYVDTSYMGNSVQRKDAVVKQTAKQLKKKRLAAKEKARRSPTNNGDIYEDPYDTDNLLQSDPVSNFSKSWSPKDWNLENNPDLNSIKQSIRDYSAHLRTKYSGGKENLNKNEWSGATSTKSKKGGNMVSSSEYSTLYQSATKYDDLSNTSKYLADPTRTTSQFNGTSENVQHKYSATSNDDKSSSLFSNTTKTSKYRHSSNQYLVDKYLTSDINDVEKSSIRKERNVSPTRHSTVYSSYSSSSNVPASDVKAKQGSKVTNIDETAPMSTLWSNTLLKSSSDDPILSDIRSTSPLPKSLTTYNPYSNSSSSNDSLLRDAKNSGLLPKSSVAYNTYSSSSNDSLLKDGTSTNLVPRSSSYSTYHSPTLSKYSHVKDQRSASPLPVSSSDFSHSSPLKADTLLKESRSTSPLPKSSSTYSAYTTSTSTLGTLTKGASYTPITTSSTTSYNTHHTSSLFDSKKLGSQQIEKHSIDDGKNNQAKKDVYTRSTRNYLDSVDSYRKPETDLKTNYKESALYKESNPQSTNYRETTTQNTIYRNSNAQSTSYRDSNTQSTNYRESNAQSANYRDSCAQSTNVSPNYDSMKNLSKDKQRTEKQIFVAYREKDSANENTENKRYGDYLGQNDRYDIKFVEKESSSTNASKDKTDHEIYMKEMEQTVKKKYGSDYSSSHVVTTKSSYGDSAQGTQKKDGYASGYLNTADPDRFTYKTKSSDQENQNDRSYKPEVLKEIIHRDYEHVDQHLQRDSYKSKYDKSSRPKSDSKYQESNVKVEPSQYKAKKEIDSHADKYYVSRSRSAKADLEYNDRDDKYRDYEHKKDKYKTYEQSSSYVDRDRDYGLENHKSGLSLESRDYTSKDVRPKSPVDKYVTYRGSPSLYSENTKSHFTENDYTGRSSSNRTKKTSQKENQNYRITDSDSAYKTNLNYASSAKKKSEESYRPNGAKKPELSKEYIESINRASASMDSHMLEIKQRSSSINEDRRLITPDDASSVTGSCVSDDFVVVASGDIVRRKSKSAKKLDKAKNSELQIRSCESSSNYTDFENGMYDNQIESLNDVGLNYKNSDPNSWAEPRRHFGLRESEDNSELQWKEPKVYTTKDMKKLGYVNTGASNLTINQQLNSKKDDEWYRNEEKKAEDNNIQKTFQNSTSQSFSNIDEKIKQAPHSQPSKGMTPENNNFEADVSAREGDASDTEKQKRRVHWDISSNGTDDQKYSIETHNHPTLAQDIQNENTDEISKSNLKPAIKSSVSLLRNDSAQMNTSVPPKSNSSVNSSQIEHTQLSTSSSTYKESSVKLNALGRNDNMKLNRNLEDNKAEDASEFTKSDNNDVSDQNKNELHFNQSEEDNICKTPVKEILANDNSSNSVDFSNEVLLEDKSNISVAVGKDEKSFLDMSIESNETDAQNETLPTDPYERQQLISDIIQKYTKDMDQTYLMQRDQIKKESPKKFGNKNIKSRSPSREKTEVSASNKFIDKPAFNNNTMEDFDEDVFPLRTIHEKKSRIPVASRSPSRSPSHSRRGSVDSESGRTKIPVSRSLSREKLEYLTKRSPVHSRSSSTDNDHGNSNKRSHSFDSPEKLSQNNNVTKQNCQDGKVADKNQNMMSENDINEIMRKYAMFNEEWKIVPPESPKLK